MTIIEKINKVIESYDIRFLPEVSEDNIISVIESLLEGKYINLEFIVENKDELEKYNIFYNKDTDKGFVIADFGTVKVYKEAIAIAYNHAMVISYDRTRVTLYDNSSAQSYDISSVAGYDRSHIFNYGYGMCHAYNNSFIDSVNGDVMAFDNSHARSGKGCIVTAFGNADVRGVGSTIHAVDHVTVWIQPDSFNKHNIVYEGKVIADGDVEVKVTGNAEVILRGNSKVIG